MSAEKHEAAEAPGQAAAEDPQAARAAAEKKAAEYYDQLLRLKAEFENFRKRTERERPDLVRLGRREVLARLLPLHDALETARQAVGADQAGAGPVAVGVELLCREFAKLFEVEGLKPMEAVGRPYDHDRHDVMGTVERPDLAEGTVVEELQKGFLLEGRVLRHAKVRISRKPAAQPPAGADQEA
jgi:molecular chaperone GrpE